MQVSFSFYYAASIAAQNESVFANCVFEPVNELCERYLQCLFLKSEAVVFHFISVRLKLSFGVLDHVANIVICVEDKSDASFSY